jgi:hypothetical protein
MKTRILALALGSLALLLPSTALAAGQVKAGAAIVDGTYHVGTSAGQYSSTRDGGLGDADPHMHSVKNQPSYGVQSRIRVRALVVQGANGKLVAMVSDNHYIAQDALFKRTAQLVEAQTGGALNRSNLTMAVTHNHSSPSHSALAWGVWAFQDVFDFRFFDYYARQNAKAIVKAYKRLKPARVSATVSYFDAFQRNPMGPGRGDDGTPVGFPRPYTDHDLSVVRFEDVSERKHPKPLATLVNIGMHPEFLEGYDLISAEYPEATATKVDRLEGGVTILTQNATGTSEVERDNWHDVNTRAIYDHAQYQQMEWGAHQLAEAVRDNIRDIEKQKPNRDDTEYFGMTSYRDRFIGWMSDFPVGIEDRWFPGPVSHPYPGVSSCRTDAALAGAPRVPVVGLPDCTEVPVASSLSPVTGQLPAKAPGIDTDDLEALGVPIPENYSAPSTGALQDSVGVHLQAFRLGDILFTVCSCEQWVDQSYNVKTRADTKVGNEYLGYDPTGEHAHPSMACTRTGDGTYSEDGTGTGTWRCSTSGAEKLSDRAIAKMRAQIRNDAGGWDDPTCTELGCGIQAESESTDLAKIRGNYTHDDTTERGGKLDTKAPERGYRMIVPIAMANDYNGYIATYRDYMNHDHYRKALTGWGPHSSDYMATRMVRMGHALKGDAEAVAKLEAETVPGKAPEYTALAAKEVADQAAQEAKVRGVGEVAAAAVKAYDATLPDDGGTDAVVQPKDIERFDAATFTWEGGNNHTDDPVVTVQRRSKGRWAAFADQSGEIPVTLKYPSAGPEGIAAYRAGGQTWKWTATFEAFVSRFALPDLRGRTYRATPTGEYRFVVRGRKRAGGKEVSYTRTSAPFAVKPWSGITVEGAKVREDGTVAFEAGPTHTLEERTVRKTDRAPLKPGNAPVAFEIGPVDYPDVLKDPAATGARFLSPLRGYSAASFEEVEHYCLDCRFRDWMDVTDEVTATVIFTEADGSSVEEEVEGVDGAFRTKRRARAGETVSIVIRDRWGNTSGAPVAL